MDAGRLAAWRDALARVLEGRDLEIVTQPVVALQTGSVVGYEALTRFAGSPPAGPGVWFRIAAEFGVSPELMAVTLRRQLALAEHVPKRCLLAVKVSCVGVEADPVQSILEQTALDRVVLELDDLERFGDGDDPGDLADLGELIGDLRAKGALVALTIRGRADLEPVIALGPDVVRLDRSLIEDLDRDEAKSTLVETAREQFGPTGAQLLAHGIENPGELNALMGLGVPLGQGYLLGKPAPGWARPTEPGRAAT